MKNLLNCPMHPKAPLIAGIAVIIFTLVGMYAMSLLLWLDVLVGIALIYAGATGHCVVSGVMKSCWCCKIDKTDAAGESGGAI